MIGTLLIGLKISRFFRARFKIVRNGSILNPILAVEFAIPLKAGDFYSIINFVRFLR